MFMKKYFLPDRYLSKYYMKKALGNFNGHFWLNFRGFKRHKKKISESRHLGLKCYVTYYGRFYKGNPQV